MQQIKLQRVRYHRQNGEREEENWDKHEEYREREKPGSQLDTGIKDEEGNPGSTQVSEVKVSLICSKTDHILVCYDAKKTKTKTKQKKTSQQEQEAQENY